MTMGENLAKNYPLHFQRICEIIHKQYGHRWNLQFVLAAESTSNDLLGAFDWNITDEGHRYWARLSRVEK